MEFPVINISAYRFAKLDHLKELRHEIKTLCNSLDLKGTILLSVEGINLFMAGIEPAIEQLLVRLRQIPGLETLVPKISRSNDQPFNRLLVKIKKEIISFGVEGIDPIGKPSRKISARELKQWLDEKRPVTLLDTRNDYEIKLGTFHNAINPNIHTFRQFPQFAESLEELKDKPIVMFCTGGIRCEKAGPFMEKMGFKNIFQLDGGILKYFEEVGSDHYEGDCFVFDGRVGVDPSLAETEHKICFACLAPLTLEEQKLPAYIAGKTCPYCYKSPEQKMAQLLEERHRAIQKATEVLPGQQPYLQKRPLRISQVHEGYTFLEAVSAILKHVDSQYWQKEIDQGLFTDEQGEAINAQLQVKAGERYYHLFPHTSEPPVSTDIKIRYEDEAFVVVEKPAPLPVMASGRFERNTLQYILNEVYSPLHLRPVHRLDSNTTGLILFAKTRGMAAALQKQFLEKTVEKTYLVKIKGHPPQETFRCDLPISNHAGDVGSRTIDETHGLAAVTHFRVLKCFDDRTCLLEAQPVTGRTNQIRVHLWSLGYPVCGDNLYLENRKLGKTQTRLPQEDPLCLHASRLVFRHPLTQKLFEIESKNVPWL